MNIRVTEDDAGARIDRLVIRAVPGLGRSAAKRLFVEGRVRVRGDENERGRRASKGDVVLVGSIITVDMDGKDVAGGAAVADPELPLTVIIETPQIVVVDKPAGVPTAPLSPGEKGTLANALLAKYPEMAKLGFSPREPGLCHRLDTDTSGLVLAARTEEAFVELSGALKRGSLDKRYLLLCASAGLAQSGTIDVPLAPHAKDRRRVHPCLHPRDIARYNPRDAMTTYRQIGEEGGLALVEARAAKASRHQIRAHFAAILHPLTGDTLYGGEPAEGLQHQALHAHWIGYHGSRVVPAFVATSPLPEQLARLIPNIDLAAALSSE